jgi:hypothetical protein
MKHIPLDIHTLLHEEGEALVKLASTLEGLSPETKVADFGTQSSDVRDYAVVFEEDGALIPRFQLNSRGAVEANLAILAESSLPEQVFKVAAANLGRAAKDYGMEIPSQISGHIQPTFVDRYVALSDEEESPTSVWALQEKTAFEISTAPRVTNAVNWFSQNWPILSSADMLEYSTSVVKQAETLGLQVPDEMLVKTAALDAGVYNEILPQHIDLRKAFLSFEDVETAQAYDDLIKTAQELPPLQFASRLEKLDRDSGISKVWGSRVSHPLLATMAKEADGTWSAVVGLPDEVLLNYVDKNTVNELRSSDGSYVWESLPAPVKEALKEVL